MNETADNSGGMDGADSLRDESDDVRAGDVDAVIVSDEDFDRTERRIHRGMYLAVAVAVIVSLFFNDWRVMTGVMLGGALSLLNYRWLHQATSAFRHVAQNASEGAPKNASGAPPVMNVLRFGLRHLISVAALAIAYYYDLISIVAALVGLSSFVVAAMLEAFRQVYRAIIYREV